MMSLFSPEPPRATKAGTLATTRGIVRPEFDPGDDVDPDPSSLRRFNVKAWLILLGLLILSPAIIVPLMFFQDHRLRLAAMTQANQAVEAEDYDLAILTLKHSLTIWPEDPPTMELLAKLLTERASSPNEILEAANAQDQLIRLDPLKPERQENRRRLVELYIRHGDIVRLASERQEAVNAKFESRYRSAVKIAQQRISFGADDADAHSLLGTALESVSVTGDLKALADAMLEYERALRRQPDHVIAAERLAMILFKNRKDASGGDEIIQEMIHANPSSSEGRLTAFRYYRKTGREDKARVELQAAMKLAPTDLQVRIMAATDAIQRNDPDSARRYLDLILADSKKPDRRIVLLQGQVELASQRPDAAIDIWRKALTKVAGTDQELTWRLAHLLISLGRYAEARPLVAQYARLSWDPSNPMIKLLQGLLHARMGSANRAIADLEAARPGIGESWMLELELTLGQCYESLNDTNKAINAYRLALQSAPFSSPRRRSVARLWKKTGPEKAAELLEAGIEQDSADISLVVDLVQIHVELQLARPPADRDWRKVEKVLADAARHSPDSLELIKARIDYLTVSGQSDKAFAMLDRATQGPGASREEFWLAWSGGLSSRGRDVEALALLDRAARPEAAGDRASIRAAKARLLVKTGHARAARDLLTKDVEKLPISERILLARNLAEILKGLRDYPGAIASCLEWATLSPEDPQPGLTLMAISQEGGVEEAARLGLERLRAVGGEEEPYALTARVMDLLFSRRAQEETRSMRFELADRLSQKLQSIAPQLPISFLIRAFVLEQNHRLEEAIAAYRMALRGNTASIALPRLVDLLARLKRFDEIASLKQSLGDPSEIDRLSANMSLKQGDKGAAERTIAKLVEAQPDSLDMRHALARLLRELGRPKEAEAAFLELVEKQPDRPDAWLALVTFQVTYDAPDVAPKTIERMIATYTGQRPDLLLARCRWTVGEVKEAARLYDLATAKNPADPTTLKLATDFCVATGRTARAEAFLRQALRLNPPVPWAPRQLALLLSKRPDASAWAEAWSLVAPGSSSSTDSPGDRLLRATILECSPNLNQRAEAFATLAALADDLPAHNPAAVESRTRLARAMLEVGKPADAARMLESAIAHSASNSPSLLALAVEAFARSSRVDEADRALNRLATLEPDSERTNCSRAWVFLARDKTADAVATLEQAALEALEVDDGEEAAVTYMNFLLKLTQMEAAERVGLKLAARWPRDSWLLARAQSGLGRKAEAIDSCRIAAEAAPTSEAIGVAVRLVGAGGLDPAQADRVKTLVDRTLAKKPGDIPLLNLSATLAHLQGRFEDEIKAFQKVLELDPSNALCLNNMAWTLCQCLDRPQDALKLSEEAIRITGRIPVTCDTRGVVLTRLGRFDEAIADLEIATKALPSPSRYFHLARAYQKAGKPELHRLNRDLARKGSLNRLALDPIDRDDYVQVMER